MVTLQNPPEGLILYLKYLLASGPEQGEAGEPNLLGLQWRFSGQRSAMGKATSHPSFNPFGQGPDVVPQHYPRLVFSGKFIGQPLFAGQKV